MLLQKKLIHPKIKALSRNAALVICLCASNLIPLPALSQSPGENGDPVAIYKQAGINAEQEATIRKLAKSYDQENTTKLESLAKMLQELRDMAYQKTLNEASMLAKQDEINKLQSDMALERIKLVIKIRKLLTSDQNEKLVSVLQNRVRNEEEVNLK